MKFAAQHNSFRLVNWYAYRQFKETACFFLYEKVHVGNDQEMVQSERSPHSKPGGGKRIDNHVLILREHIFSQVDSYFPIGGHSVPGI